MGDALPKRSTRRRLRQTKPPKLTNATPSPEREFAHLAPELDVVRPTRETHGALVADAIKNCSRRGQSVLDAFLGPPYHGSGSGADQKAARATELDPAYVDAATQRWQVPTGSQAIHNGTGKRFPEHQEAASVVATPACESRRSKMEMSHE